MTSAVRNPAQLIACLGGALPVARDCDVPLSDIDRWIREDALPRGLHMRLFVRPVRAGAVFDAAALHRLFGIALPFSHGPASWTYSQVRAGNGFQDGAHLAKAEMGLRGRA